MSDMSAMEDLDVLLESEEDEIEDEFPDHQALRERLRRTLYYGHGRTSVMDQTSLPMTELAVEYFQEAIPRELGRVDMYWASSFTRRASVSPCAMMLGMVYIERLKHKNPDYLEKMTSEELFLISMMLASKYLYDEGVTEEVYNDEWATATNLDLQDINQLELQFLAAIDWQLFTDAASFRSVSERSERAIALRQARLRAAGTPDRTPDGPRRPPYALTYTELWVTLFGTEVVLRSWAAVLSVCKMLAVCSVAYTAGVCTLIASPAALTTAQHHLSTAQQYLSTAQHHLSTVQHHLSTAQQHLSTARQHLNTVSTSAGDRHPVNQTADPEPDAELLDEEEITDFIAGLDVLSKHRGSNETASDFPRVEADLIPRKPGFGISRFLVAFSALVQETFGGHEEVKLKPEKPCQCPNCPKKELRKPKPAELCRDALACAGAQNNNNNNMYVRGAGRDQDGRNGGGGDLSRPSPDQDGRSRGGGRGFVPPCSPVWAEVWGAVGPSSSSSFLQPVAA